MQGWASAAPDFRQEAAKALPDRPGPEVDEAARRMEELWYRMRRSMAEFSDDDLTPGKVLDRIATTSGEELADILHCATERDEENLLRGQGWRQDGIAWSHEEYLGGALRPLALLDAFGLGRSPASRWRRPPGR